MLTRAGLSSEWWPSPVWQTCLLSIRAPDLQPFQEASDARGTEGQAECGGGGTLALQKVWKPWGAAGKQRSALEAGERLSLGGPSLQIGGGVSFHSQQQMEGKDTLPHHPL